MVIGPWIAEIQAKRVAAQVEIGKTSSQGRMSEDAITAIVSSRTSREPRDEE